MSDLLRRALEDAATALQLALPRCQLRDEEDHFDAAPILQALAAAGIALLKAESAPLLPPTERGFEPWPATFNAETGMLSVPHADGLSWMHIANFSGSFLEEMRAWGRRNNWPKPEDLPPTKLIECPGLGVGHAGGLTFCWSGTVHDYGNIIAEVRGGRIIKRYRSTQQQPRRPK